MVGWPSAQAPHAAVPLPPGSAWVSAEFDQAALLAPGFWAMDPLAVQPGGEAPLARAARMAPADVGEAQLAAVLAPLPPATQARLRRPSAWLLARWASRHNLGVHWAPQADVDLLAVRFDGLPDWLAEARLDAPEADLALRCWLGFFDLMLGRYRQLLAPGAPPVLLAVDG